MKTYMSILVRAGLALLSILAFVRPAAAQNDKEVEAHKSVLDLAGAFTNDGFKIRDGHWSGLLKPKENALIAVNLYAGNQYWFAASAMDPAKKIDVAVYDEAGKLVPTEAFTDGPRAAAGFSPTNSGQYFVAVNLLDGAESTYCLVYSYK
jgi:hypothetical protein